MIYQVVNIMLTKTQGSKLKCKDQICLITVTHILLKKETVDLGFSGNNDMTQKSIVFKNDVLFRSSISKTNNAFIDNAGYLDIVIPIYNLLENSEDCLMTSGSLRNYYRDIADNVKSFR